MVPRKGMSHKRLLFACHEPRIYIGANKGRYGILGLTGLISIHSAGAVENFCTS